MNDILITGGAGFIGSNLTDFFLGKGSRVTVIDNLLTGSHDNIAPFQQNPLFTFLKADISEADATKPLEDKKFDYIYHLASPASPKQYFKYPKETLLVNSLGTYNLLNFLKKSGRGTFIYTSTSEVYGDPLEHPQKESYWGNVNSVGIRSCYDEGKRFGEAMCMSFLRQDEVDVRIARIFNTFGPNMEREDGRVISNFIVQALQGKPLTVHGDGSQTRSFCYVSDMVGALYQFSQNPIKGEVVNVGGSDERKIIDIAHLVLKLTGSKSTISHDAKQEDDPKRRKPDLEKAKRLLSWQPTTSLEDGLKKTIAYFKKRFDL